MKTLLLNKRVFTWRILFGFSLLFITTILVASPLKKLPLGGTSTFSKIIEGNYLYVDKTEQINTLLQTEKYAFFVRPRRFGRTLFLSTVQEICAGHKDLFTECWIAQEGRYDWSITYPVIKINFIAVADDDPDLFTASLLREIYSIAEDHEIVLASGLSISEATKNLIELLSGRGKIVLLVDEYDKPLRTHQLNTQRAGQIEQILKQFYEAIGADVSHFHAIFVTGVVPYAAKMLLTAIPQLKNISDAPKIAQLCGFTDDELDSVLLPYVEQCGRGMQKTPDEVKQELCACYGGYQFEDKEPHVYSPIPVLQHLNNMSEGPYWLTTSTPTFLVQRMKNVPTLFCHQESFEIPHQYGDSCKIGELSIAAALWYAGYLTPRAQDNSAQKNCLTFPNRGTREGYQLLLSKTRS